MKREIEKAEIPQDVPNIPYVVYEMSERRHERRERKHWIAHAVAAALIALITLAYVWLWNQYDTVSSTEATGLYAMVESPSVISSDIPVDKIPEIIKALEELYGQSQSNQKEG